MITFAVENWKMLRSHNTHLVVLWRGKRFIKIYTSRYYRLSDMVKGTDPKDTLNHISNSGFCGLNLMIDLPGKRFQVIDLPGKRFQVTFGGDSEYVRRRRGRNWSHQVEGKAA